MNDEFNEAVTWPVFDDGSPWTADQEHDFAAGRSISHAEINNGVITAVTVLSPHSPIWSSFVNSTSA
jgi:hypothetical protein